MDNVMEIIKQAEADVTDYEALVTSADVRLLAAQADAAAAREKLSEARIVLDWLRRRNQPQPVAENGQTQPTTRFGQPVPEGPSRLAHILGALDDLGGTAANKQISARLLRQGIEITPDQVRGLLKYASTKTPPEVTTDPGSGVWRLVKSGGRR